MFRRTLSSFLVALLLVAFLSGCAPKPKEPSLMEIYTVLKNKQFVDLTHAFHPGIPHWPGFPDEERTTLYWYEEGKGTLGSGFFAEEFCHVGQWGTHVDPPAHFIKGLRTVDQIDVKEMILPLVVIDIHEKVAQNPDYTVTMDDVKAWEAKYGLIPEGAFVALRTDWSKRWPDMAAMRNEDAQGIAHYPGWTHGGAEVPLRRAQDYRLGPRDNGHRSGHCHQQGRLLSGSIHPEYRPFPD